MNVKLGNLGEGSVRRLSDIEEKELYRGQINE